MLTRYRLFLGIAGAALAIGLAVALAPGLTWKSCAGLPKYEPGLCSGTLQPSPDWATGFWVAVVVYALLVGLILSARALSAQRP